MNTLDKHPYALHPKELLDRDTKGLSRLNRWIAVKITKGVGTMWCAYAFFIIDLVMLPAVIQSGSIMVWVDYIAQTILQLVLLPVIMVGQNVIKAQNDRKADTDHRTLTYLAMMQDEQMLELKKQTDTLLKLEKLISRNSKI